MQALLAKAQRHDAIYGLLFEPMGDGDMGSLRIGETVDSRKFGRLVAEGEFLDRDGVPVIATLNADADGELLELDIWRVDFAPLQRWPHEHEVGAVLSNPALQPTAFSRG